MNSHAELEPISKRKIMLELLILSLVSLFLELLIVRWMSADFRAFSVFKTFPLVTCFVGLGVGFAAKSDTIFKYCPLALLLLVGCIKVFDYFRLALWMLPTEGLYSLPAKAGFANDMWYYYVFIFMLFLALLLLGPFCAMATIGARLATLFNHLKPLPAYIVNIGGAIAGSLLFSVASFTGLSPEMLLVPVCIILYYYLRSFGKFGWKALVPLLCVVCISFWDPKPFYEAATIYWSPYQRIELQPQTAKMKGSETETVIGYWLRSNRAFYQFFYDLSERGVNNPDYPEAIHKQLSVFREHYLIPYSLVKPKTVLVVGAGTGNDVAEALRQGATTVDAVDIDPVILRLGKQFNPAHPYDSPLVNRFCDDARHYMNSCHKKYDLIIFGQLDSQTGIGQGSSMRLDNYVFTKESIRKAADLLQPEGIVCLSFGAMNDRWFQERMFATIKAAVGYAPMVVPEKSQLDDYVSTYYILGQPVAKGTIKLPEGLNDIGIPWRTNPPDARILTDDWPYLYLIPIAIDIPYLLVMAEVLLLALFAGRRVLFARRDWAHWQLFFMGSAFILLELQSIARLALVYGSTALTSAAVITGILIMILLATIMVLKNFFNVANKQSVLYMLLAATLVGSYALPVDQILAATADIPLFGTLCVTFVTLLPMFIAGIIFAAAFATIKLPGPALAFNLLGSVLGAMLEYVSNYTGINGLIWIAGGLYLASYLCQAQHKAEPASGTNDTQPVEDSEPTAN
ncbi:MAG: hypothetical protein SGJ27_14080 [Candidatus Melainabacteria bacterium]|nr:hypothetical protein [Candidatus Melainabacteria bacterium]